MGVFKMLEGLFAFFASFGFAILFNIKSNRTIYAASVGGIGGIIYKLIMNGDTSKETLALFVASLVIGICSEFLARKLKCPTTTFQICALIPLVPGGGMYNTMLAVVNNDLNQAIKLGVNTAAQACAIVIACVLVSSIIRTYNILQVKHKDIMS